MTTPVLAQHLSASKTNEGIEITENGKRVLFYQQRPKSLNGKYERGGYVHPLYSLNEKVITEDFPEDHPYHHGVFWAWHQIILNGKNIADGWTYENIFWQPQNLQVKKKKKKISLNSEMIWKIGSGDTSKEIIKERTKITAYKSTGKYRVIDFDINLSALADNLQLGGSDDAKGYGGFCLRLKMPRDISFVSNDSIITPIETAVTAGPWMNFIGSFEGTSLPKIGAAVFCKKTDGNRQSWILRKEGSMQNVPYPGRTPVLLPRSGWRLQYRLVIHENIGTEELEKLYLQYLRKS